MPRYLRFTISGTLASGTEEWSTTCHFQDPNQIAPSEPQDLQGWADNCATDIGLLVTSQLKNGLSITGAIRRIDTYEYEDIGEPASLQGGAVLNYAGSATAVNPLPTSMVGSLRTGLPGRRYRGRMYWPAVGLQLTVGGRFSTSDATGAPPDFAEMLEGISTRWPATGAPVPVVVSKVGGVVTPVTSIQVGDVPDTQRRRRDALVETYSTSAYPPP